MAVARHELGLSATKSRFPTKATCLAIYSRAVNSETPLGEVLKPLFPWCAHWEPELRKLFEAYVGAKQSQNVLDYDDLLLYWSQMVAEPLLAREIGERFDHVLVDEYQDTNRLQASILLAMKPTGSGLTVVGDDAQSIYSFRAATVRNILDFPSQFTPHARIVPLDRNYRSTQPILDASNAVIGLAAERYTKNLWTDRVSSRKPPSRHGPRRSRPGALRRRAGARIPRDRNRAESAGGAVPKLEPQRAAGARAHPARHSVREVRRAQVPGSRPRQGRAVRPPLGRESAQPHGGISRRAAAARRRARDRRQAARRDGRAAGSGVGACGRSPPRPRPPRTGRPSSPSSRALRDAQPGWPAEMDLVTRWYEPHLQRIYEDAHVRQGDLVQLRRIAATYPTRERFLTEVTLDPPGATSDEAGVPGRDDDYLDPVDDPFGKGPGMEGRPRPQRGGRLHPVGHGHGDGRRDRGGAAVALCRDDAGEGASGT